MLAWLWLVATAGAGEFTHTLVWDLSVKGTAVGTRELTVRYLESDGGASRILESFTDLNGTVGPVKVRWRQRMTAHVDAREPASFHSVMDQNGAILETIETGPGAMTPFEGRFTNQELADLVLFLKAEFQ